MERTALPDKLNNKGMTLIEMLIALVILLITSLAMMQTAVLSIQTNLANSLREEALSVAEARMNELRNLPFLTLPDTNALTATPGEVADTTVQRTLRAASVTFTRKRRVVNIGTGEDVRQVTVTVTWKFKNVDYTHSITTIVRRQS